MNHPQLCPALRSRQAFFGQWSKQVEVFSALISRVFRELTLDPLEQPGQVQVYHILSTARITCHRLFADQQQYDLG